MATEKRLIDAYAFYKKFVNDIPTNISSGGQRYVATWRISDLIADSPTVDAAEVVHGSWVVIDHDGSWRVDMCSNCHKRMHYTDYDQPYPYCPNCGADMR